jgi:PAS domain S-box-containing protein
MAESQTRQNRSRASRPALSPSQPRSNVAAFLPASIPLTAHGEAFPVVGIGASAGGLEAFAATVAGDGLHRILGLLLQASGVDFTHYKPGTVQRRIQRRMAMHGIQKLDRHAEFLKTHAVEAEKLHEDLLIAVTTFFRAVDKTQKVFAKKPAAPVAPAPPAEPLKNSSSDRQIAQLEQELSATKEYMQSVVEDFEVTNEELKAVNEELEMRNVELGEHNEAIQRGLQDVKAARDYADAIIATTRQPLVVLDGALRVLTVNTAFLRTFKVTHKQTVGRLIYDLGNRQWDMPQLRRLLEKILPANTHCDDYRVEHMFPKIGRRAVLVHARRLEQADEGTPAILLAFEDGTEQERAEAALWASGERLALAASRTRIGMFDWNLATGKMLWTEQHAYLLGFPTTTTTTTTLSQTYTYRDWARRVHPQDLTRVEAERRRCMARRVPFEAEYRVVWPDKSLHWITSRGVFQCDPKGKPQRMLGIIMDITDRKRAEEQLKELNATLEQRVAERTEKLADTNERLQAIMDTALIGIITLDERGVVESFNPAALQIFGCAPKEFLGQNISRFLASPDQPRNADFIGHFLRVRNPLWVGDRNEVLGRRKDGVGIMLELSLVEITDRGRRRFVAMLRDITKRKRLERELLDIAERERQRIGHDLHDGLGQQLHGVSYLAALLEKDLQEDTSPRAAKAGQLNKHLQEALDLTRSLAHGLQPVKSVPEGLMIALRELAERTRRLYRIDCRFDCRAPVLISRQGAATHLYRIAQEAVNNAMKHGKPARVRIKLAATRQRIILGVCDNGVGIPRKMGRDDGMGLHVMRYRADVLSGSLVVQKLPHGGTEVICTVTRQDLLPEEDNSK